MASIAVVALGERTAAKMAERLRQFFTDRAVIVTPYCLEKDVIAAGSIKADLAVLSSSAIVAEATPFLDPATPTLIARRIMSIETIDTLLALPRGSKVLVCHKHPAGSREIIRSMREMGLTHIQFYSIYDDDPDICSTIKTAICAGDTGGIPDWVETVINLGPRDIELSSLLEIARLINYPLDKSLISLPYTKEIVERSERLKQAMKNIDLLRNWISAVLNSVQDGLIAIDGNGRIQVLNHVALRLAGIAEAEAVGRSPYELFPELRKVLNDNFCVVAGKSLVRLQGDTYHVTVATVSDDSGGFISGAVIVLRCTTEVIRIEKEVRSELKARGHVARYRFSDILGVSPAIRATIAKAKKLAASNLNVLILGENGTGKELFAQSIHNASARAKGPFVAANCAALPASLIESELFGYEEGAFTGARKGGKPGLIELAHGGTIFLDEIGDLTLESQARLLRVIQEKEVMRVGCTRVINVDVRIIAATNRDLRELVATNKFRQDLYYRLFVAPLMIPPLRERKQDIPFLARQFLRDNNLPDDIITPEVMLALTNYNWPGNVRELQSIIQYAAVIGDDAASINQTILERLGQAPAKPQEYIPINLDHLELPLYRAILELLAEARQLHYAAGRGTLCQKLAERGFIVSEQMVRRRLEQLRAAGLVVSGRGRQATRLTGKGETILAFWQQNQSAIG